jgi:hypothetical protein
MGNRTFVVYRRVGETVTPHEAWINRSAKGWVNGQPVGVKLTITVGQPIAWSALYAGHTAWIGEQIAGRNEAIKKERARRAARKQLALAGAAGSGDSKLTA